jgi:cell division protein FtsL
MAQIAREFPVARLPALPAVPVLPPWSVPASLGVLMLLASIVAATYLAHTGNVATMSYSIQRQRAERDAWRARNEQLRLELAKARSLTWVEHEAVTRLQMRKPSHLIYLRLDPDAEQATAAGESASSAR